MHDRKRFFPGEVSLTSHMFLLFLFFKRRITLGSTRKKFLLGSEENASLTKYSLLILLHSPCDLLSQTPQHWGKVEWWFSWKDKTLLTINYVLNLQKWTTWQLHTQLTRLVEGWWKYSDALAVTFQSRAPHHPPIKPPLVAQEAWNLLEHLVKLFPILPPILKSVGTFGQIVSNLAANTLHLLFHSI